MNILTNRIAKIISAVACVVINPSVFAQMQTPKIEDFTVNGIHVVMRQSDNQVVAIGVIIKGGYGYNETNNPYIAKGMADVTTSSGSEKYSKDAFRASKERMVTTITGSGDYYYISYWLRCVKPQLDKSWDMLADVIMHPLYDSVEWRNIRDNEVNDINDRKSSPDRWASFVCDSIYRQSNSRFGRTTEVSDVQGTTLAEMKQFHDMMMQKSRMTIIVVGNISRDEITNKLAEFGALPDGSLPSLANNHFTPPAQSEVFVDNRPKIPTTYVYGLAGAPDRTSQDFWAAKLTSQYLSEKFFEEVRTKRNLSYAPYCYVTGTMHNYRFMLGVSSVLPDSAVGVELTEIKKVQNGDIDKKTFEDEKNVYITNYYEGKMTNLDQAMELSSALRETGDWHDAYKINNILTVTPGDAQRFASKYLHNILYSISGDKSKVTDDKILFN